MQKLSEPEDLEMLRHRFARTIEIWVAYNTFLNREVLIGNDKICLNDTVAFQTTHTLLIAYYSFVFSLFDPSAVNFKNITEKMLHHLPQDAHEARDLILEQWEKIKIPLSIVRNNIGFHHSPKRKGANTGYQNYGNIHPLATELIMQALRVFFRRVDAVFESHESYGVAPNESDTMALMDQVRELKNYIVENPHEDAFKKLNALLRDS
ncbi:hypothetical protein D0N50_05280 [Erwinia billingiae]|uniref:hypothetical protein n=1 Tax=Erwinia billingiae TaxID=182337 RepID=UPI001243D812|nr:hypothetical protein [Erwinia billingiae]QEW31120.1 hypothetical protein D0N50_05280 [Erwinia billingiae]